MYKTVRHGENSLQYTILPQQDDGAASSCRSGAGRRPRRKGKTAAVLAVTVVLICGVIATAVLVPLLLTSDLVSLPAAFQRFSLSSVHAVRVGNRVELVAKKPLDWYPHHAAPVSSSTSSSSSSSSAPITSSSTASTSTSTATTPIATPAEATTSSTMTASSSTVSSTTLRPTTTTQATTYPVLDAETTEKQQEKIIIMESTTASSPTTPASTTQPSSTTTRYVHPTVTTTSRSTSHHRPGPEVEWRYTLPAYGTTVTRNNATKTATAAEESLPWYKFPHIRIRMSMYRENEKLLLLLIAGSGILALLIIMALVLIVRRQRALRSRAQRIWADRAAENRTADNENLLTNPTDMSEDEQ